MLICLNTLLKTQIIVSCLNFILNVFFQKDTLNNLKNWIREKKTLFLLILYFYYYIHLKLRKLSSLYYYFSIILLVTQGIKVYTFF